MRPIASPHTTGSRTQSPGIQFPLEAFMTQNQGHADPRILKWLDQARARLLDLSMRNRALNFRVNKVTTIEIVDEVPAEVFRRISIDGKPMKFRPAADVPLLTGAGVVEDATEGGLEVYLPGDDPIGDAFEPSATEILEAQHTDEWLQTRKAKDHLDVSLRRIEEHARLSIEEQGVNPLYLALGIVRYREADASTEYRRAPLVLIPASLERKGARATYSISAADDPLVNPSLVEYLKSFHVEMPRLPEPDTIQDGYDLREFMRAAARAIEGQSGWSLTNEIYLGLFSFAKLALWEDLGRNERVFAAHPMVERLVTHTGPQHIGLPEEIRSLDLDTEYAPEVTHQVVDADASQVRAIVAVARGHDLVIIGPPGTGKSQTITNLIAEALSSGKTVLFVAEKRAALDVVHRRLERVGLGEFCLELHSSKASKRSVLDSIGNALNLALRAAPVVGEAGAALPDVRRELTEYSKAVHETYGAIGLSPFRGFVEYEMVRGAPRATVAVEVTAVTKTDYDRTIRDLDDLSKSAVPIGDPAVHPFREASKSFYSPEDVEDIGLLLSSSATQATGLVADASVVAETFGLPLLDSFETITAARATVELIGRSPGAPKEVLASDAWNAPPPEAAEIIALGREVCRLRDVVTARFKDAVLETAHDEDIAYVERKSRGVLSVFAWFEPRFRAVRSRWVDYRLAGYGPSLAEQASDMRNVVALCECRGRLERLNGRAQSLFGTHWNGEKSSWTDLEAYVSWVVSFRAAVVARSLAPAAVDIASTAGHDGRLFAELRQKADELFATLTRLEGTAGWPSGYFTSLSFGDIASRVKEALTGLARAQQWAAFERARQTAASGFGGDIVGQALKGTLASGELSRAFRRAFWSTWLVRAIQSRPSLEHFDSLTHEERIQEFRKLDAAVLVENQARLVRNLRDRTHRMLQSGEAQAELPYLNRQISLQRRHAPLRRTIREAGTVIRSVKPCMLMSPLTVAQMLADGTQSFDLVVFDEASQLPVEDAVGAICRGRQVSVVGDAKQLPPTNFFGVTIGTSTATAVDDDGQPVYTDAESILDEIAGSGVASSPLLWHYRSAHESLIQFSNSTFYDGKLYTFPSTDTGARDGGVTFEYVEEGCYEKGGLNMPEARRVAGAVVEFARANLAKPLAARQSLGVGTFNLRQSIAILDELERERRADPELEPFFAKDCIEPFFVKNLENIQGDERDQIMISVTYGKGANGQIRFNFGPLNGVNGGRRLNVLVTRARRRMRVFSSMRAGDMNIAGVPGPGAALLKSFLRYAETGVVDGAGMEVLADAESPFEREVLAELLRHGLEVHPQVGSGKYRIDLGVIDSAMPGRYLCGIECDGVAYHASETARDRDRLRQQVLEARGWTIHRIWSTDWFKNRPGQIERILGLVESTRNRARSAATENTDDAASRAEPESTASAPAAVVEGNTYVRPVARPYLKAPIDYAYYGRNILQMASSELLEVIGHVARHESPIAWTELVKAIVAAFGTRAGSRIETRLVQEIQEAVRQGRLVEDRGFYREASVACEVRSRAGTGIDADRIPPEEYRLAVIEVLRQGKPFSREALVTEIRDVFGYRRAGESLRGSVLVAVEELIAIGRIGEGATGLAWRER